MRPIDADALLEEAWDVDCRCGYVQVVDVGSIEEAPTIEAKPIVHAHWKCDSAIDPYCCSNCGKKALQDYFEEDVLSKYCPYCGAQMDEMVVEENATTTNNTQKVSVDGVKIPVIGMEDVPKLAKD